MTRALLAQGQLNCWPETSTISAKDHAKGT